MEEPNSISAVVGLHVLSPEECFAIEMFVCVVAICLWCCFLGMGLSPGSVKPYAKICQSE